MTKLELIGRIHKATGLPKHEVKPILESLFSTIKETVVNKKGVFLNDDISKNVEGFGIFKRKRRPGIYSEAEQPQYFLPVFVPSRSFIVDVSNVDKYELLGYTGEDDIEYDEEFADLVLGRFKGEKGGK